MVFVEPSPQAGGCPPIDISYRAMPRIVLGAASSDSGKTTLALGIITALRRRGRAVSVAKCGPDFIDSAHLARASGGSARNLDAYLAPEAVVQRSFERGTRDADIAIVEGVMGLFDGRYGSGAGSTAHIARILEAPVLLVLNCAKASATIGAIAFGLSRFDPRVRVVGAILNKVASDKHAATVRDACTAAGVPVLGVIRRDERLTIASVHLGLAAPHGDAWGTMLAAAADIVERDVDLDALVAAADCAPPLRVPAPRADSFGTEAARVRVAVARDEAFWFYDEAGLDALRDGGAELVPYAPLRDPFPTNVAAAFVGGGYPESHAPALAANVDARATLRAAVAAGMPVYAECGGLMYLGEALENGDETQAMVGAIPAISTMSPKRSALRYVEAEVLAEGPLFARGAVVRGHEFHYSRTRYATDASVFAIEGEREGFARGNVHASYVHVHLGAYPHAVDAFLNAARAFGGRS
jgi:cobyrinic acid a,c-diamide synthase